MKELSIEEKAKRYDEAIERARVWKEKSGMPADRQGILDDIFPELKVSEDEEVRKALYEYFKKLKDDGDIDETWYGFSYDKILNWLEKQGEQIHANSAKTCKDEQKPTWSEKDEECADIILRELKQDKEDSPEYSRHFERLIDWFATRFKSIISQTTWRPSEEQLEALDDFIYSKYPNTEKHGAAVKSLYQDLKKLGGIV